MLAVIPVRDGVVPAGGVETADECADRTLLIGSDVAAAATELTGEVRLAEVGAFRPGAWAAGLATALGDEPIIVLPTSPDGRDLGPRLAAALGRPYFAGAIRVTADHVIVARSGGLVMHTITAPSAFVATLQVGVRGVDPGDRPAAIVSTIDLMIDSGAGSGTGTGSDAEVERILEADAATIDLAEAGRIIGGGAGLGSVEAFSALSTLGVAIGASVGATRVITDRGWVPHERQIGTTGVIVDPDLYIAFGVSGAVQHTSGLGRPDHIISINTDAHCPMMQLADLAVVADANEVLTELLALLPPAAGGNETGAIDG